MADNHREAMLEALKGVLEQVPGVRFVSRQAITPDLVSERQMPAIIIDESQTQYTWAERHGRRMMRVVDTIGLDCQVLSKRGDYRGNPSTVRQAFAWMVLNQLANNPTLNDTCKDAALRFNVQYPDAPHPFARAIIAISIESAEAFDDRPQTEWQKLILSSVDPQPGRRVEFDLNT